MKVYRAEKQGQGLAAPLWKSNHLEAAICTKVHEGLVYGLFPEERTGQPIYEIGKFDDGGRREIVSSKLQRPDSLPWRPIEERASPVTGKIFQFQVLKTLGRGHLATVLHPFDNRLCKFQWPRLTTHPEHVRLNGIDCPEKGQPFGTRAGQAASGLVFGILTPYRPESGGRSRRLPHLPVASPLSIFPNQ